MKPPAIALEHLESLPIVYRFTVPEEYRDAMGHMNMRWYLAIYDEAGIPLFDELGLTLEHYQHNHAGGFDLEHHIHYLNEVRIGDTLTLRARLLGRSAKRLHYLLFMVNESRGLLASIFECVNSYADLSARRTAPYPPEIAANIDAMLAEHQQLTWAAPVCGAMGA
ncbi:MAG TPA: thioesterase family protein [Phototrophicaceae bacterium]|nr:thioesterase family protein [Phototrophicaceae bacterium]